MSFNKRSILPAAHLLPVTIASVLIAAVPLTGCSEDSVKHGALSTVTVRGGDASFPDQAPPQLQSSPEAIDIQPETTLAGQADIASPAESGSQQKAPLDTASTDFCTVTRGPYSESRSKSPASNPSVSAASSPRPSQPFDQWLSSFQSEALQRGLSQATLTTAFAGIKLNRRVLELDRRQQEFTLTFFQYLRSGISEKRIKRGRALIKKYASLLAKVDEKYGTPPELLVALWGMETDFGANMGGFRVIESLASLAYDGRRSEMYHDELLCALRIIEDGHIPSRHMIGSWAGAMGQPQFMPSTFMRFARDGNSDGKYDIWGNLPDVFESAANYLASIGWERDRTWGREVKLPSSLDPYQARLAVTKTIEEWRELGLVNADGSPLPYAEIEGSVILPAGIKGPAFLVYNNFRVITEWNRSLYYALTVAHLSDRLSGRGPLVGRAPPGDHRISRQDVIALQEDLNHLGFDAGLPDGMVGTKTREAVRKFQRADNIPADGYPTANLIARLNAKVRGTAVQERPVSKAELRALQKKLHRLGYDTGVPDGVMGPKTRGAVRSYQQDNSIPVDGLPTPELIRRVADDAKLQLGQ